VIGRLFSERASNDDVTFEVAGGGVRAGGAGLTINAHLFCGVADHAGLGDGRADHAVAAHCRCVDDASDGRVGKRRPFSAGNASDAALYLGYTIHP
jgi:hypothetical protein